jgi:hypothetical protein
MTSNKKKISRKEILTQMPDQTTPRTSGSVLNKLEKAPNPRDNITPKAIPVTKPICSSIK